MDGKFRMTMPLSPVCILARRIKAAVTYMVGSGTRSNVTLLPEMDQTSVMNMAFEE